MQNELEIRYLKSVVVLAEELSYTRAAKRLQMSQSGLTRRIQDLESTYSLKLFARSRSSVELTDAGRAFVEQARLAILHDCRAIEFARAISDGVESTLTIGRSPYAPPNLASLLLSVHLPLHPNLRVELHSDFAPELIRGVLSSELDLALVTRPGSNPKISSVKLIETPMYLVTPDSVPTTGLRLPRLQDLAGMHWIMFDLRVHPELYDRLMQLAKERGVYATRVHHVMTADEAQSLLSNTGGVAFLTKAGAERIASHGLVASPLDEPELLLDVHLAVRVDNGSKLVSEFVRTYMKTLKHLLEPVQFRLPMIS